MLAHSTSTSRWLDNIELDLRLHDTSEDIVDATMEATVPAKVIPCDNSDHDGSAESTTVADEHIEGERQSAHDVNGTSSYFVVKVGSYTFSKRANRRSL